ncbi:MAG: type IX secretion system membrane protein PorP/SprF [Lewinellaceae bacterium]|nr:type IX secretion system membrane protein PorP/SprF [Lewinellaceae bacterium]
MKKLLLSICFLGLLTAMYGQDEAVFSHYHISPILVNPAFAGFKNSHQIQFNARAQWTGFPDAPKTLGVQYHGPLGKTFGLGLGVLTETAGRLTRLRAQLNYAFRFDLSDNFRLSTGFSTEFQQLRLNSGTLGDNFYDPGDVIVEGAIDGREVFDASFGVFASFGQAPLHRPEDKPSYIGLSFANLVRARLDDIVTTNDSRSPLDYYVLLAGHRIDINNAGVSVEPSVMLRQIKDAPFQLDVNMKIGFLDDQLFTGASYRSIGSLGLLMGTQMSNFRLFYTYDLSTQDIRSFSSGTHEITVAFGFESGNQRPGYPRR